MGSRIPGDRVAAIRTLVLVIEAGSLTDAARRLALTPSAVSKQISRLEEDLGARLLERTTRRVRATAVGLELYERTRSLFEAFEEAESAVRSHRDEVRGRVRISASPAFGRSVLPGVLARLARAHPALSFDVVLAGRRLDFIEDELDLAVREGPLEDSTLIARRIGDTEIVACAAPAYLDDRGRPAAMDDLAAHDLVAVPPTGPASDLARLRGRSGKPLRLRARLRVNDLFAVRDLAERGCGIAFLPDYLAGEALAARRLERVLAGVEIGRLAIHVVSPSRRHLPRATTIVADALADAYRSLPHLGRPPTFRA